MAKLVARQIFCTQSKNVKKLSFISKRTAEEARGTCQHFATTAAQCIILERPNLNFKHVTISPLAKKLLFVKKLSGNGFKMLM